MWLLVLLCFVSLVSPFTHTSIHHSLAPYNQDKHCIQSPICFGSLASLICYSTSQIPQGSWEPGPPIGYYVIEMFTSLPGSSFIKQPVVILFSPIVVFLKRKLKLHFSCYYTSFLESDVQIIKYMLVLFHGSVYTSVDTRSLSLLNGTDSSSSFLSDLKHFYAMMESLIHYAFTHSGISCNFLNWFYFCHDNPVANKSD